MATTIVFTDDPLIAGETIIKAVHLTELRQAVNAVRTYSNLAPFSNWIDAAPIGVAIKALHLQELREKLDQALQVIYGSTGNYTDPTIVPGQTVIKAAHFQEIRQTVK